MHLGIDFGTTHSVVALADRGNYPVVNFVADDASVCDFYPSVLADNGHELRFGFEALAMEGQTGWHVLRSFKRAIYEQDGGFEQTIELPSGRRPAVAIIAAFLRQLRRDLKERSNLPKDVNFEDCGVVLAVPAQAPSAARLITLESFRQAEFRVLCMLNEPSAAGIEYAHRYRSTITAQRENVLVYDLGGGTFDSSLVLMRDRKHDVMLSRGLSRLGGDDFDECLLALALVHLGPRASAVGASARRKLKQHCREQKEKIHANTRRILLELGAQLDPAERDLLGIDGEYECVISAAEYEQACRPLVLRTLEVLDQLQHEWSIANSTEPLTDLAGIYVVGGASALPVVARTLREVYGRRIHRSNYPSSSIAMGLAIAADEGAGYARTERFSRQFGVFREGMSGEQVAFDVIFDGSTQLPTDDGCIEVRRQYAPCHNVGHYRYIECGWLDTRQVPSGDITSFANVLFPFDPSLRSSASLESVSIVRQDTPFCEVEEVYRVDRHGIVELTLRDRNSTFEIKRKLTQAESP
jgi:molecular chaperone DnaK (HSP70)